MFGILIIVAVVVLLAGERTPHRSHHGRRTTIGTRMTAGGCLARASVGYHCVVKRRA
jgi:hypothetical protein